MDWQASNLNSGCRYAFMALVRQSPAHHGRAAIAASVAEWNRLMRIADEQLARTGAWMAGETFTLADVVVGLSAHRWLMAPIERRARGDRPVNDAGLSGRIREGIRPGRRAARCAPARVACAETG